MNTYKITGRSWNMEKKWYPWDDKHIYPHFESEDETRFEIQANSLHEAYKWMLETHPGLAVGCSIVCQDNSDFICDAVFDYYYSLGMRTIEEVVAYNLKECNRLITEEQNKAFA